MLKLHYKEFAQVWDYNTPFLKNDELKNNNSFRNRIFLALLLVNILFLSVMAYINFYQNSTYFKTTKVKQIQKVDSQIQETFNFIAEHQLSNKNDGELPSIFQERVLELSKVYSTNINIYDLEGKLLVSNRQHSDALKTTVLSELKKTPKVINDTLLNDGENTLYNSFVYIRKSGQPIAILNTQNSFNSTSTAFQNVVLLKQYFFVVLFLMILSGFAAWFISKVLTKKIENISDTLENTDVSALDQPLSYSEKDEIKPLVDAYNNMLSKLKKQTYLLQKNEREEAWKEMAKQVAHEINNPLTPLRLTIQNFQRKYRQDDPENEKKVKHLTESVVHQIDIISSITKSFSDFAKMPVNQDVEIDVVETIQRTVDIFPSTVVYFSTNVQHLYFQMDSLYLTRIVTNIVKNGIQAIPPSKNKKIIVNLTDSENEFIISITDNGNGIAEENQGKIFEPNFTTKSTGMGLGLSMVKKIVEDYQGSIWFVTKQDVGTTFYIQFNKNITN